MRVKFIKTAVEPKDFPKLHLPEIAVVGRSNVGKSSLLNDLLGTKIARTSSTPGKTQTIQFFTLDEALCFVDLPGYGFAKVPLHVKKNWAPMVQGYLEGRKELKLILLLLDIRREPSEEDLQMLRWAAFYKKKIALILTKVDKVSAGECKKNTEAILEALNCKNLYYIHYSIPKKIGKRELQELCAH